MTVVDQQHIKDPNTSLEVRVLTLNIWGILGLSKNKNERVQALGEYLSQMKDPYHFVFLQEVWCKSDYSYLADKVNRVLPFAHYFESGVNGSGLCVFSCSPITEVQFHRYLLNGYPHKVFHADWFGGKGVGLCRTSFQGVSFVLVNTHLHAEYDSSDFYLPHRVCQAYELSQLIRFIQSEKSIVVCAGDLNSCPTEVPYRYIINNTDLIDTFFDCPIIPADGVGATNEIPSNSYTPSKALMRNPDGCRIDYLLYHAGAHYQVKTLACDLPLPSRVPQKNFSYSDHEAVRAVLSVRLKPNQQQQQDDLLINGGDINGCFSRTDSLLDASAICSQGIRSVSKKQKRYLWTLLCVLVAQGLLLGFSFWDMSGVGRFFTAASLVLLSGVFCFCFFEAVFDCSQEFNALSSTKNGLEKLLNEVRQMNAKFFEQQHKSSQ